MLLVQALWHKDCRLLLLHVVWQQLVHSESLLCSQARIENKGSQPGSIALFALVGEWPIFEVVLPVKEFTGRQCQDLLPAFVQLTR